MEAAKDSTKSEKKEEKAGKDSAKSEL